jgi:hypothetical protein
MNKVSFSSLNVSINESDCLCSYCDGEDDISYQVKRYLPFTDKVALIEKVINQSLDDNGFYNPMRVKMFILLECVFAYTNLEFSEEDMENLFELYDRLVCAGVGLAMVDAIEEELNIVTENVWETIKSVYSYRNSAMGILEHLTADYDNLKLDATEIQKILGDEKNLELLKNVITKLG